jgi:hypothetical protein
MHELFTVLGLWLALSFSVLAVWVAAIEISAWRGKHHRAHAPMGAPGHPSPFA